MVNDDTKDIFDSISHVGDYAYLECYVPEGDFVDLHIYSREHGFIPAQKSEYPTKGESLWVGVNFEKLDNLRIETGRPMLITPLNKNWEKYVGALTDAGKKKLAKEKKKYKKSI